MIKKQDINIECNYSFEMLYREAFKKDLSKEEKKRFQNLPQEEINKLVLKWSKRANWVTEKRFGLDGQLYISFHP